MATTSVLVDDLNGESPASVIYFSILGKDMEIDLTEVNAKALSKAIDNLATFLDHAEVRSEIKPTLFSQLSEEDKAAVRAFHKVGPRSRPSDVLVLEWQDSDNLPALPHDASKDQPA